MFPPSMVHNCGMTGLSKSKCQKLSYSKLNLMINKSEFIICNYDEINM